MGLRSSLEPLAVHWNFLITETSKAKEWLGC